MTCTQKAALKVLNQKKVLSNELPVPHVCRAPFFLCFLVFHISEKLLGWKWVVFKGLGGPNQGLILKR